MNEDWKNALAALRGNVPEAEDEQVKDAENPGEDDIQKLPVRIYIDKKGRNGKTATIIEGFTLSQSKVDEIARKLKQKLGVGGSTRDGEILIQGDHKAEVAEFLKSLNIKAK